MLGIVPVFACYLAPSHFQIFWKNLMFSIQKKLEFKKEKREGFI
jgi:hypothetical protein